MMKYLSHLPNTFPIWSKRRSRTPVVVFAKEKRNEIETGITIWSRFILHDFRLIMSESYFRSLDACYIYTNQTAFVRSNLCATCFFQVRHKVVDNLSKLMYKFFHIGITSSVTYSACTF